MAWNGMEWPREGTEWDGNGMEWGSIDTVMEPWGQAQNNKESSRTMAPSLLPHHILWGFQAGGTEHLGCTRADLGAQGCTGVWGISGVFKHRGAQGYLGAGLYGTGDTGVPCGVVQGALGRTGRHWGVLEDLVSIGVQRKESTGVHRVVQKRGTGSTGSHWEHRGL